MHTEPWDLNSKLVKENILLIANLIKTVRGEVIELHNDPLGDSPQSLGFRCYECCRTRLKRQDEQKEWSWFSVLTPEGRFTFSINGVPVRFARNIPEELPKRKLIKSAETTKQMDWLKEYGESPEYAEIIWFIIIDTPYSKAADTTYFVGYSEIGEVICQWEIPLEDKVAVFSTNSPKKSEPVKLPEPQAFLKSQFKANKKDNEK